jgi:restriction system protein
MSAESSGPRFVRYCGPVLQALSDLGGSGRPAEVADRVAASLQLSDAELTETLDNGTSRFRNQVAWARFYLVKAGHLGSSKRGVWNLTDKGKAAIPMSHAAALTVFAEVQAQFAAEPSVDLEEDVTPAASTPADANEDYRLALADRLHALSPSAFERFAQRLLREAGFQDVLVTGKAGDGGIDGVGLLQVNPLVSFKVLFQCKKYSGSVTPSHVRDFRGSMQGRADKGIIISTGTFTSEARKESTRDGAPPIELIDGERLLDMCEELELGLRAKQTYEIDEALFADLD